MGGASLVARGGAAGSTGFWHPRRRRSVTAGKRGTGGNDTLTLLARARTARVSILTSGNTYLSARRQDSAVGRVDLNESYADRPW